MVKLNKWKLTPIVIFMVAVAINTSGCSTVASKTQQASNETNSSSHGHTNTIEQNPSKQNKNEALSKNVITVKPATPFMPIVRELVSNIPIIIPRYWTPIPSSSSNKYYGVQFKVNKHSYYISLITTSKQFPPNDPQLSMPPNSSEANQWGGISGAKASNSKNIIVERPKDAKPVKIGGTILGWKDPVSVYWESNGWKYEVIGSSNHVMDDTMKLINSLNINHQLKKLNAKSGQILISNANSLSTFINWYSSDGQYEYSFQYKGSIEEALKIANSCIVLSD
ncbi:hypothetical protein [Desulfotomaculum copahuensis]|uniref:hypothetical protein n=1 Tax=Desulfotomaculum copahuensis TaxID=1838280 RepID=UPI000AF80007|nr:hypothetical protein [Desulfotomaculum copahuensis]